MARNKKTIEEMENQVFATKLRKIMQETGVSQAQIAEKIGKSRQVISQYMHGESEPTFDTLCKIAQYFDVSIDWLLGRAGDRKLQPCAVDQLGLSEESINFLKSLNDVRATFETLLDSKMCDRDQASHAWNDAIAKVKCLSNLRDYELRAYANFCANYGASLVDVLISAVEKNYRIIVDFNDLQEANPQEWNIEDERLSYDDFVRFKSGEISKAIDRHLVSEFEDKRDGRIYYDRVTDEIGYLYKFED